MAAASIPIIERGEWEGRRQDETQRDADGYPVVTGFADTEYAIHLSIPPDD
nr:hypothetical protein [Tanacetum cinerariifolium]